ncbi:MAG: 4'-phosphopantetheinyl transferase family protein [Candidatus Sumerlaeia bacterium]
MHTEEKYPLRQALPPDTADLWLCPTDGLDLNACARKYLPLLNAEEKGRYDRYRFDKDKLLHLLAHVLKRDLLSRYLGGRPESWKFRKNEYGKPDIENNPSEPPLRFNLSHTKGMVVCGLSQAGPVGVDVESEKRRSDFLGICDRFFSQSETTALRALEPGEQRARFLSCWTLKESYMKALGKGITIPLDSFSFDLDSEAERISVTIDGENEEETRRWRFALMQVEALHWVSISLRARSADRECHIRAFSVRPFQSARKASCRLVASSEHCRI